MSIPLRCLMGRAAAEPVTSGWGRYQQFPPKVQSEIWDLIAGGLANPGEPGFQSRVHALCEKHGLTEADAIPALQACGLLLGQATVLDLPERDFSADLLALSSENAAGLDAILPRFTALKCALREAMLLGTLADHGKVLLALDWRVDRVSSSNRAAKLETDVVFLTLKYREGESMERITMQVTTRGLQDLRAFLERFKD